MTYSSNYAGKNWVRLRAIHNVAKLLWVTLHTNALLTNTDIILKQKYKTSFRCL